MAALIALAHIVGAIVVLIAFSVGVMMFATWVGERNRKAVLEEISLALGIPAEELDGAEHVSKLLQFGAERLSSELLRNRISDMCGWIQTAWGWLGPLLQVGVVLGVIWATIAVDVANGVNAWWIVGLALFFWIASLLFGFACKLLTGRVPGQARLTRKSLAEAVRRQRHVTVHSED
ncbi:hypothetical protein FNU76_02435 [Chitinimonas arctica]|uniref:Uncharacterized protein n=1 Tax=Chitinimonas arctica TaxID=2594795 RepID=A0A516SAX1_9NEIS|nr:hypothetical protein [Chitinimonas arctica]QDQ25301.1 hypothetical protein FNU76_02435 [Chitinimonas arctica]